MKRIEMRFFFAETYLLINPEILLFAITILCSIFIRIRCHFGGAKRKSLQKKVEN